ncbi:neogenin isoform X2 [Maniola jurtina]|uniref:neogenin isoform X2 n=1 Tax=Maniola jurtina TaxID=191418 RepID=UPI001E68A5AB|nr:neogenin isoform X2 [Maniola jurtina]
MWRTEMCRFGAGNWIFLLACVHLFTCTQGGEDAIDTMFSLTSEPADLAVAEGEPAMLLCGAPSPARLSWRYSASAPPTRDHALPTADSYRRQLSNGSLVIENMSAALAGQYQCVATVDGVGTVVSRVANLFLAEVPELGEAPRVIMGVLGSPALLSCPIRLPARLAVRIVPSPSSPLQPERRVYGAARIHAPPPVLKLNVTWLKNGSPVRMEAARVSLTPGGALEIDPLRTHDAASYRCSVALAHSHKKPSLGPETELRVNSELANLEAAPRFITTPQPVTVMEGASVTFDCAAVGNPKPEMVWLNNGVAIDLNDLDSRFYLVGSGSLRVQTARALDAGTYTCRATNRLDSADHSTQLHVMTSPRVTLREGSVVRARTRGDVTLRCEARGRPPPAVTWLKDGEPLTPNDHDIALVDGSSLRIRGVLAVDAGVFQCAAASLAGSAAAALRLIVTPHDLPNRPKPPKNSTQDIFNSLVSDLDQTLDPTPEDLDFLGETSSAYTSEPLYDDYSTLESYNSDYDDFHAAQDLDVDDVRKANATVVSAPQELRAVIVKHRFVTLSWQEPENKMEPITGYAILYKVKGSERERISRGDGARHEMNVASLQPNTTYQFQAVAVTHHAVSPPTQIVEVTTPEEELTYGPPRNVAVEAAGPHALRVAWQAPDPLPSLASSPPPPTRFAIYYTEVESGREQSQWAEGSSSTVGGLRAATAYRVRVSAAGGAASPDVVARTPADAPAAPPANVTATPTSDTSILVRWEAPPPRTHRGALTGYKLRYRVVSATTRRRADSLTTPADTRRAELRGLEPSQTYQIRVCAINANGSGPFSEWVSASTQGRRRAEAAVPAAPPPLTTRAGRDWISVWWGPGDGGGGDALVRGHWLGWGLGVPDEHSRELPAHAHSHVIRGLESNAEYVISLRASNALGLGPAVYATVRTKPSEPADDTDEPDEPDVDEPGDGDEDEEDDTPPLIPPVGLKVIMLSGSTAVVYWTDPSLPKGAAATDGRRYAVRAAGGGRTRVYNASDLNCMIDDLRPFTKYEFAVKLIKGGRESAWSMLASNTSLEAAPGGAPRDLRVSAAAPSARAADLTWSPPQRPNGIITGYVIMYAVQRSGSSGAAEEWTAVTVVGDRTRSRVDRLRARTTYSFKIQARNSKGLGPFSSIVTYTTGLEGGEGGGLASATSAWLWASAGGACAVLALAAALALSLCCRRNTPPMSPDTSTYQKASASAAIKPPDLWIHHDQMELKHMDKSLHSSAISAGSVEGSALVSSTLTLARAPAPPASLSHAPPVDYEPARHAPPSLASLDRRYVPTYVESRSPSAAGSGSDDTAILRASPAAACRRCDYRCDAFPPCLAMTGVGVGVGVGLGVGCTGTCERRRHMPDQSTPLLAGVAPLGSPQSSLASLHAPPPAPCGSGQCPLGAACSAPGVPPGSVSSASDVYASASTARERGHYVAYEPLGHYTHRESLSADGERACGAGAAGAAGAAAAAGGGSLSRRGGCAGGLHSFALPDNASDHSTPSHSKAGSVRETSPYKKSASSSPGHIPNRLQLGGVVSHCSSELEPLTPSRSTERLHREMQNLEGLMKDLSAITQSQFHC